MTTETNSTYLEERILSATPLELIEILYEAAIDRVRTARLHLQAGDAMARSEDVSKTLAILSELTVALDGKEATESAAAYSAIYLYLQKRLVEAHSQPSDSIFAEVEDMLGSLAENWRGVKDIVQKSRLAMDQGADTVSVDRLDSDPERPARCWNL